MFNSSLVEDNNSTKVDPDEEFDVSKQCMITPLNPIEDFNKLLKNGFNADIGIPKFVFSHRSIFYLLYCMILCSYEYKYIKFFIKGWGKI